ncbi:MAG: hypothetical protein VYD57_17650 [Pseudomonadota bacterium]|nr:hypothetical protein [Pseudomonadota bacterium]
MNEANKTESTSDTANVITAAGGFVAGTDGADRFVGTAGEDVFYGGKGDDVYEGNGGYDQVDFGGKASDYTFKTNEDGSVTVSSETYGTDTLKGITGVWFAGEAAWYDLKDLVASISTGDGAGSDVNVVQGTGGYTEGTDQADLLLGTADTDVFYGGKGDDRYEGGAGYDQVNFDGKATDYTITRNADGTVSVAHPTYGTDTLSGIRGLWFSGEEKLYNIDDLAKTATPETKPDTGTDTGSDTGADEGKGEDAEGETGSDDGDDAGNDTGGETGSETDGETGSETDGGTDDGDDAGSDTANVIIATGGFVGGTEGADRFVGTSGEDVFYGGKGDDVYEGNGGYDQVDFDGKPADYSFKANADGSVTVSSETYGTDTLKGITGVWFAGEDAWYDLKDLIATVPTGDGAGSDVNVVKGTGGYTEGTDQADLLLGTAGTDVFYGGKGDDRYEGGAGYDQVNFDGKSSDYTITRNGDGTVSVASDIYGTDTLSGIRGLWFAGEEKLYNIDDLAKAATPGTKPDTGTDGGTDDDAGSDTDTDTDNGSGSDEGDDAGGDTGGETGSDGGEDSDNGAEDDAGDDTDTGTDTGSDDDGKINEIHTDGGFTEGTDGADRFMGSLASETFYGGKGDDAFYGAGGYDQVDYDGKASDYTFARNANGSVTVTSEAYGQDLLSDIDGIWFRGEEKWYAIDDLAIDGPIQVGDTSGFDNVVHAPGGYVEGADGDDLFIGTTGEDHFYGGKGDDSFEGGAGYDQVDFDGKASDYTILRGHNGTVTFISEDYGTDRLTSITGVWFRGEEKWYDLDDLVNAAREEAGSDWYKPTVTEMAESGSEPATDEAHDEALTTMVDQFYGADMSDTHAMDSHAGDLAHDDMTQAA